MQVRRQGDNGQSSVGVAVRSCGILVKDGREAALVVHPRQCLHEVADLLPLVVVALEKVPAVLDGNDDGAGGLGQLGLCGEGKVGAGGEGDDRGNGRRGSVFVVAERAGVEDAGHLLEFGNGVGFELGVGLVHALGELAGVVVYVIEIVLWMSECIGTVKGGAYSKLAIFGDSLC